MAHETLYRQIQFVNPGATSAVDGLAARSREIVAGACRAFLAQGYDGCSMELIAAEAGVTKKTLYNHFESKQALFEAVTLSLCKDVANAIDLPGTTGDVEADLMRFCRQFVVTSATPPGCEVYRLAISVGQRHPEFGRSLIRVGTSSMVAALAAYLKRSTAEGRLRVANAEAAAEYLFGNMLVLVHRVLFGAEFDAHSPALDDFVRGAVTAFCRGYAPPGPRD